MKNAISILTIMAAVLLLTMTGCRLTWTLLGRRYVYEQLFDHGPITNIDTKNQREQIAKLDPVEDNVVIYRVIYRRKDHIGIYAFRTNSVDFGSYGFFLYKNGVVELLNRNDQKEFSKKVEDFLIKNNFNKRKVKICKKKIEEVWKVSTVF